MRFDLISLVGKSKKVSYRFGPGNPGSGVTKRINGSQTKLNFYVTGNAQEIFRGVGSIGIHPAKIFVQNIELG